MKKLITAFLLSASLTSTAIANPVNQNDLGQIFDSKDNTFETSQLSQQEMKETEGAAWWFLPMLYEYGLISTTVGITSLKVHQIMQRIPVSQIYKSVRSYRIRNQVKREIQRILNR